MTMYYSSLANSCKILILKIRTNYSVTLNDVKHPYEMRVILKTFGHFYMLSSRCVHQGGGLVSPKVALMDTDCPFFHLLLVS